MAKTEILLSKVGEGLYQEKTVTPTKSQQIILPDDGYDALSQVTVNAYPTTTINYNFVKSVVDSHTKTHNLVAYSSRTTVNSGGIYLDTSNRIYYMYCDFTIKTSGSASNYGLLVASSASSTIIPAGSTGASYDHYLIKLQSTTSTNNPQLYVKNYDNNFMVCTATKYVAGENYKIFGIWTRRA